MTEQNNQLKAPVRSYEGQLRQVAGDRKTSLAAYAADEIARLRLELAQEQKRLDWSLKHGAVMGSVMLTWFSGTGDPSTKITNAEHVRAEIDKLILEVGNGG